MSNDRIRILDGLRLVAIIMVMLFHYYSRFYDDLYTYEFSTRRLFSFGYLGVELFFIISGFVITLTLRNCSSFSEFIKKRFIRLIPGMLICSVLTFTVFFIVRPDFFQFSFDFKNLLISNSFISPELINTVSGTSFSYIDGAYWSLWVEITFYFTVAAFYFINKKTFIRNYTILSVTGIILYYLVNSAAGNNLMGKVFSVDILRNLKIFTEVFSFLKYSLWFLIGIYLLEMYTNKADKRSFVIFTLVFIFQTALMQNRIELLFSFVVYPVLLMFIYKPEYLSFLSQKIIARLGVASYSIYLIHQNLGVLIINKFSSFLHSLNILTGLFIIVLFCSFGLFSYRYYESRFGKYLLGRFITKKQNANT